MKHSGLAAELHVVFSGGSTGEGGGGRGEQRPEKAEPTAASPSEGLSPAQPQLSQQTASCAQLPEDAGTPPLATRLHLALPCGLDEHLHLAEGRGQA